jgi:hypothetical protein
MNKEEIEEINSNNQDKSSLETPNKKQNYPDTLTDEEKEQAIKRIEKNMPDNWRLNIG